MGINFLAALDLLNTSGGALDTHAMVLTDGDCLVGDRCSHGESGHGDDGSDDSGELHFEIVFR